MNTALVVVAGVSAVVAAIAVVLVFRARSLVRAIEAAAELELVALTLARDEDWTEVIAEGHEFALWVVSTDWTKGLFATPNLETFLAASAAEFAKDPTGCISRAVERADRWQLDALAARESVSLTLDSAISPEHRLRIDVAPVFAADGRISSYTGRIEHSARLVDEGRAHAVTSAVASIHERLTAGATTAAIGDTLLQRACELAGCQTGVAVLMDEGAGSGVVLAATGEANVAAGSRFRVGGRARSGETTDATDDVRAAVAELSTSYRRGHDGVVEHLAGSHLCIVGMRRGSPRLVVAIPSRAGADTATVASLVSAALPAVDLADRIEVAGIAVRDGQTVTTQLGDLLESVDDGMILIDRGTGRALEANAAACLQFGLNTAEQVTIAGMSAMVDVQQRSMLEHVLSTPGHVEVCLESTPDRPPTNVLVRTHEVIRPGAEAALAVSVLDLDAFGLSRSALADAERRADRHRDASSRFVRRVADHLLGPANAIGGFAELLGDSQLDEGQRNAVERIRDSGHSLAEVVSAIIDLARIEAGTVDLAAAPIDVITAVAGAVNDAGVGSRVQLELDVDSAAGTKALANRQGIGAALAYSLRVAPTDAFVGISVTPASADWVRISIDITAGAGGRASSEVDELALHLAREVTEAMGGRFNSTERDDRSGWALSIDLRRASRGRSLEPAALPRRSGIICASSDEAMRSLTTAALETYDDHELLVVRRGCDVEEAVTQRPPLLVVIVDDLTDTSAAELVSRLRRAQPTNDVPVIVIHDGHEPFDNPDLVKPGRDRAIVRPFKVADLRDAVETALGGVRA